jgi:thioredoxin 1
MARVHKEEMTMATNKVTDSSFDEDVIKSTQPVVVDFWAEWCGPCKQIAPALEEIAGELGPKVKIVKLNIDENPAAPDRYGVRGIPTLMLFNGGQVAAVLVGARPKSQIKDWVQSTISDSAGSHTARTS